MLAASSTMMPPPSMADGMFTDIQLLAPADEHTGNALLCFLSPDTFVGLVELTHEGERHVLRRQPRLRSAVLEHSLLHLCLWREQVRAVARRRRCRSRPVIGSRP